MFYDETASQIVVDPESYRLHIKRQLKNKTVIESKNSKKSKEYHSRLTSNEKIILSNNQQSKEKKETVIDSNNNVKFYLKFHIRKKELLAINCQLIWNSQKRDFAASYLKYKYFNLNNIVIVQ